MSTDPIETQAPLYSVEYGVDGPPLLLLHGLGGGGSTWESVARLLSPRRVVVPDLLGFGRSPRGDSAYTIDDHLDALFRLVEAKGLQSERFDVAGHSMGAILAAAFAARHPNLVGGLALAGLPIYQSREQAHAMSGDLGLLARLILKEHRMARVMCHVMCTLRPGFVMIAPLLQPTLPANVARDAFRHTISSFFLSYENVILGGHLDKILDALSQKPVLIIHGESDDIAPFPLIEQLPRKYPDWQYQFVKDGGHLLPIKKPSLVAKMLQQMTQSDRPSPTSR